MPIISPVDPVDSATGIDPGTVIVFDILSANAIDLIDPATVIITINSDVVWEEETAAAGWDVSIISDGNSFRYFITNFAGFSFNEEVSIEILVNGE